MKHDPRIDQLLFAIDRKCREKARQQSKDYDGCYSGFVRQLVAPSALSGDAALQLSAIFADDDEAADLINELLELRS